MKNSLISLLIIGSLIYAGFGLVMMSHMDGEGHARCPFETTAVADCAQVQSPISFVTSHLGAFSKFSSAVLANSLSLVVLYLLWALAVFIVFNKELGLFKLKPLPVKSGFSESFIPQDKTLLISWLSLHENSPSFF